MLNIFKMDMRRIFHSKMFYICLFSMILVTGSMIIFGVVPDFASIMGAGAAGTEDAMMGNMMGVGMAFMMISIFFALFVCQEFSSGFAKNIFARHANPKRYISGKLLSLTASGSIMLVAFLLVSMLLMAVAGGGIALPGGVDGLLGLVVGKMFSVATLASLIIFTCLFARKSAVGIVVGVVTAMGAIPMLLNLIGGILDLPWIAYIMQYTISGLSGLPTLTFSTATLAIVIIGNFIWTVVFAALSSRAVKVKDI